MSFFYAFFMILSGKITTPVASGFGADYAAAFTPRRSCGCPLGVRVAAIIEIFHIANPDALLSYAQQIIIHHIFGSITLLLSLPFLPPRPE